MPGFETWLAAPDAEDFDRESRGFGAGIDTHDWLEAAPEPSPRAKNPHNQRSKPCPICPNWFTGRHKHCPDCRHDLELEQFLRHRRGRGRAVPLLDDRAALAQRGQAAVAKQLGIGVGRLRRRMDELGIDTSDRKGGRPRRRHAEPLDDFT